MKLLLIALITLAESQAYAAEPMHGCIAQVPDERAWQEIPGDGSAMLFLVLMERVEAQSGRIIDGNSVREVKVMEPKIKLTCGKYWAEYRLDKDK